MRRKTHEEFIKEMEEKQPNIEVLSEYIGATKKVDCKCKVCNYEWSSTPDNLIHKHGCPKCSKVTSGEKKRKTTKQFKEELSKINPNIEVLGEYIGAREHILVKCKIDGHEWSPMATTLVNKDNVGNYRGCPKCGARSISEHMKVRMKGLFVGEKHPFWNPNLTDEERNEKRDTQEHVEWRKSVFERDDYTCQCCGQRGGRLNAHHIFSFKTYIHLRLDINNGVTLCKECHKSFHKIYGNKGNNTLNQFIEFLNNFKNN